MQLSISTKLIILLFLFGLVPIGTVSFIAWEAGNSLNQKVGKKFEIVAGNISNTIDRNLFERYGDVQAFVLNTNILRRIHWYDRSEENSIQNLMNTLVKQYAVYDLMMMVDVEGKVIAVNNQDREGQKLNTQFIYDNQYAEATWFQRLQNQDFTTEQPHSAPGNSRLTGTVVEDVHIDQDVRRAYTNSDGLTLGFSAPIYEDGKIVAFWTNRTNFSVVEEIVIQAYQELKSADFSDAEITILDGDGAILMDYDPTKYGTETVIHDLDSVLFKVNLVKAGVKMAQEAVNGRTGFLETRHARKNIFQQGGYTHLQGFRGFSGMNWAVLVRVPSVQATAERDAILNKVWLAALLMLGILLPVGYVIGHRATGRLSKLEIVAQEMANGNFASRITALSKDEFGNLGIALNELGIKNQDVAAKAYAIAEGNFGVDVAIRGDQDTFSQALQVMIHSLREVRDMAQRVSEGNFSHGLKEKSENDLLGHAMNQMVEYFQCLAVQVGSVADGNYTVEIKPRSAEDILGHALSKMVEQIRMRTDADHREAWLKASVAHLTECIQGESDVQIVSSRIISELSKLMNAGYGVVYVRNQSTRNSLPTQHVVFTLEGAYAYQTPKHVGTHITAGEGLVGQCALEKQVIVLSKVPSDYVPIQSGTGEQVPTHVIVSPVLFEGEVIGVIELATFQDITELERELLQKVSSNVGVTLNSLFARQETEQLLEQSQSLALELQVHHEELQATNEELQAKAQELHRSEEALQQQSQELKMSNEDLQIKSQSLEIQYNEIERKNQEIHFAHVELEKKAQDLAQASQYKSEFLANMSHELRTPLNSLLILSDSLSKNKAGNLTLDQVEKAQVIHSGGKDLLTLINDILDLSKVEAGKLDVQFETLPVGDILAQLRRQFTPIAEDKGLALRVEAESNSPTSIRTDGQRIQQILRNLLSNALKFTENGSVSIRVHRPAPTVQFDGTELSSDTVVAFSVTDTGIGIPEDKLQSIFGAFQQADGSTSRRFGGTGLGLSISRELAKLLGGEIGLQSEEDHGSTFTLYLPIIASDVVCAEEKRTTEDRQISCQREPYLDSIASLPQATKDGPEQERIPDDRESVGEDDRTVLIIEDDVSFAKILIDFSREQGFKCLVAGDGRSGFDMAKRYAPNAIVLDIGLPHIDGLKVLDALKSHLDTRHIPVHVISAFDTEISALQKRALGYLKKPVSAEAIHKMFQKFDSVLRSGNKEMLIVEDSPIGCEAMKTLLAREDIHMTFATNGKDAYQQLIEHTFDCMVLDLGLPDMTGFELLEQLKHDPSVTLPPIVVYTGQELTKEEYVQLSQNVESVVLKGVTSSERLLADTANFLHSVAAQLPEAQRHIIQGIRRSGQTLEGKKILVVDDDMRNTFAVSTSLQECGCKVVLAANGQLALDALDRESDIEMILMDIMMPVMNGIEAIENIRERQDCGSIPIIALTALTTFEDRDMSVKAGANDFMAKPVDVNQLIDLMNLCLQQCYAPQ